MIQVQVKEWGLVLLDPKGNNVAMTFDEAIQMAPQLLAVARALKQLSVIVSGEDQV